MTDSTEPIAYVSDGPRRATPTSDALRGRIPGWGADLDPADRPSVPRLNRGLPASGAHWDFPARQPGGERRERSIEHAFLTPVFGTAEPLHGVSGVIRRFAYRYSEGRAAHWLILILGDRVDAIGAHITSFVSTHPDHPVREKGVLVERGHHPIEARIGSTRADVHHSWIDPLLTAGPWIVGGLILFRVIRRWLK